MGIGIKLNKVMEACRYMTKDGRNDFQKYDYTTAASIFGKINEAMTAQGLYVTTKFDLVEAQTVTTARGNTEKFVAMKATITVHDAYDAKESVQFEGYGSGQDAGDKAIMKANTAALKYAYIGGLCISMGDDPEDDRGTTSYQPADKLDAAARKYKQMVAEPPAKAIPLAKPAAPPPAPPAKTTPPAKSEATELVCEECGRPISGKVADFSYNKYHQYLCFDCQRGAKTP